MKRTKLIIICWGLMAIGVQAQSFGVLTYNIRLDVASDGINRWDNRKIYLVNLLKFYEPAIFGIQEGLPHQVEYIDSSLIHYTYTGVGREDGNDKGEYSAIYYDTTKFNLIHGSTFWLSETPEQPSMGWDAAYIRICTYGFFRKIESGKELLVLNTHFDNRGAEARKMAARIIIRKIKELNTNDIPLILMGDLNLTPDNEVYEFLSSTLTDSKMISKLVFGPEGTFNGFHFDQPVLDRIDYIFISDKFRVKKYAVLNNTYESRYPSDHLPVFTDLELH